MAVARGCHRDLFRRPMTSALSFAHAATRLADLAHAAVDRPELREKVKKALREVERAGKRL